MVWKRKPQRVITFIGNDLSLAEKWLIFIRWEQCLQSIFLPGKVRKHRSKGCPHNKREVPLTQMISPSYKFGRIIPHDLKKERKKERKMMMCDIVIYKKYILVIPSHIYGLCPQFLAHSSRNPWNFLSAESLRKGAFCYVNGWLLELT